MILLDALQGHTTARPPFWFMRQAGRYLPEYMQVRTHFPSFMEFCYTPEAACEVTLQPITRYGMDAAIIFSDILVIPDALGQQVGFTKGEGPVLGALPDALSTHAITSHLAPVYDALRRTRAALAADVALIGFAGAPWTLAMYMLEGKSGKHGEFATARTMVYHQPEVASHLRNTLVEAIATHLIAQIDAGANALQLFDSWAGLCPAHLQQEWLIQPIASIIARVKAVHPDVPVIVFGRCNPLLAVQYAHAGASALGVDTINPLASIRALTTLPLQGNLDPILLASDAQATLACAKDMRTSMHGAPYIANLGHGVLPHTPIDHVAKLAEFLRSV